MGMTLEVVDIPLIRLTPGWNANGESFAAPSATRVLHPLGVLVPSASSWL